MTLDGLKHALANTKSLTIERGKVCIGGETFPARTLAPFDQGEVINIEELAYKLPQNPSAPITVVGATSSLRIDGHNVLAGHTVVQAAFELAGNQDALDVTLRYELEQWRFLRAFPELPVALDSLQYDYGSGRSVLDKFKLVACYLYLTTHKHELRADTLFGNDFSEQRVTLKEGLNFIGKGVSEETLGFLAKLITGKNVVLQGQVIPRAGRELPALEVSGFPWDVDTSAETSIPGILLEAALGSGLVLSVGSSTKIEFTNLRLGMYSPVANYWISENASYAPVMAYLGDIKIGNRKLATMSARVYGGRDDELVVLASRFGTDITFGAFLDAIGFKAVKDEPAYLPGSLGEKFSQIHLKSASISVVGPLESGSYEVASTEFTIASKASWTPFEAPLDKLFSIGFKELSISIANPFDSERRDFSATVGGEITFLGILLSVTVEAPNFYVTAEQIGSTKIYLQEHFKNELKMDLPLKALEESPTCEIKNTTLSIVPGSYYAFSMNIVPGKELSILDRYALPDLHLAVTCTTGGDEKYLDWQFEARAKQNEGVPVFALIEDLARQVGIKKGIKLPQAVRDLITIDSVAVSYDSRSRVFGFESWGELKLNDTKLNCCFTVEHSLDEKPEAVPTFGGQIFVGPEAAPLSFSLRFSKDVTSTCALAAYNDPIGYELKIHDLVKPQFPDLATLIPTSLTMTLKSALLAYYSKDPPKEETGSTISTTESGTGSGTKPAGDSVVLFGVDLGAKVQLSDLPIVGRMMPKEQAIGFESLRIILASGALDQTAVDGLDTVLSATGVKPLSDVSGKGDGKGGLQEGCNITAELLFGSLSRTLSLPVTGKIEESPKQPTGDASGAAARGREVASPASAPTVGSPPPAQTEGITKWFEIDKSMGPVTVRRVGLGYENGRVGIKFDASLQLSVLTFTLDGLGMTYPLDMFTEPSKFLENVKFTLDGMGLALGNGPIEIGGSLVRIPGPHLELLGTLVVRTAGFSLSAFGSYIDQNGTVSVTAFAVLLTELGDPTATGAFLITGLAFGFGVNRSLILPPIEKVETYPLIKAAMGEDSFAARQKLPAELREYASPAAGNFWIAAGIKFNSFGMVDSFLLVSVSWGAEIEIGLLGLSRMSAPTRVTPDKTIACAELALRGVIRIAEGLIQFEARLTDNSFIFSKDCRLTGGFAFCVWFKGPHAGDFVISLGGYHPAFVRPANYPLVPRVGMQLQIGTELSITGEAYFALTPSCIMAGGKLCAVFKSGGIEAWFIAYADFLMNWQPFYYQAAMGITLGVALRLGAIAIRLELSVDLRLQGPPFGGEALVRLWVISFTIPFGAPAAPPKPLDAAQFINKCLPAPRSVASAEIPSQVPSQPDIFSVRITGGLLREQEVEASTGKKVTERTPKEVQRSTNRIVNAHQLSLAVQSVIPCTEFDGLAKRLTTIKVTDPKTGKEEEPCGIRPMGKSSLKSVFSVTADGIVAGDKVKVWAITGNVPDALWGKSEKDGLVLPKVPENKTIPATVGIRIECVPQAPQHSLDIPIAKLKDSAIPPKHVDWALLKPAEYKKTAKRWTDYKEISSKSVTKTRNAVLECLRKQLPADWVLSEPNLEVLSETKDYFQQQPELNAVGY